MKNSINIKLYNEFIQFNLRRYNERFKKFNLNPKTLGWDKRSNQRYRFQKAIEIVKIKNNSILDLGCGLGDFLTFLNEKNIKYKSFAGVDINSSFIASFFNIFPKNKFFVNDFMSIAKINTKYDYIFAFGLINLKYKNLVNFNYLKNFISKSFKITKKALVFDFISSYQVKDNSPEHFIITHDPSKVIKFILSDISSNVSIHHDYKNIPHKECMVVINK